MERALPAANKIRNITLENDVSSGKIKVVYSRATKITSSKIKQTT